MILFVRKFDKFSGLKEGGSGGTVTTGARLPCSLFENLTVPLPCVSKRCAKDTLNVCAGTSACTKRGGRDRETLAQIVRERAPLLSRERQIPDL